MNVVALLDDGLHCYSSLDALVDDIEALDADVIVAVFDEAGQHYGVDWIEPNTSDKGVFGTRILEGISVRNGRYRLLRRGVPDAHAAVQTIAAEEPRRWHEPERIQGVLDHLRGVAGAETAIASVSATKGDDSRK